MIQLSEHFINILDNRSEKEKYLNEVSAIILNSYDKIGGRPTHDITDYLDDKYFWKLVKKNDKIVAAAIYKFDGENRKYNVVGTDGSSEGKAALFSIFKEDIELFERGAYGEASGATEHILVDKLGAKRISNKTAQYLLKNKFNKQVISLNPDGYHYTRMINGKSVEKVMIGNIPKEYLEIN